MAHAAVDAVEEALDETKELLLPFDWRLWAKIAVIALFASGIGGGIPSFPGSGLDTGVNPDTGGEAGDLPQAITDAPVGMQTAVQNSPQTAIAAVLVLLLLGLILVFGALRSIFDFVLFQSLQTKEVRIRPYVREHARQGVRLFGFRIGFYALFLAGSAAVLGGAFIAPFSLLLLVPIALVGFVTWMVVAVFVKQFLPLIMLNRDVGVVEGVKQLYTVLRPQWKDAVAYIFVQFMLGIAVTIVGGLVAVVMLLPLALIAVPALLVGAEIAGAVVLVLGVLSWVFAYLYVINGPATTFIGYYHVLMYDELVGDQQP